MALSFHQPHTCFFEIQGLQFWKPQLEMAICQQGLVTQSTQKLKIPQSYALLLNATSAALGEQSKLPNCQNRIAFINVESSLGTFLAVSDLKPRETEELI